PSGAEVRAASQHAADDLGRRRSVDRFTRDLARATARADDARYELGSAETAVASAEEALVRVASGLGLERAGAGAAALLELVDALDAIARLRSDRVEVAAMLERADQAAARYEADVARLAAALDVHGPPELAPTHGGHIALVAALGDELRASLDRAHERDARRRRADEARSALVRRLEAVPRSRELAEELASGDPGAWRVEQESLSRALETAEARHDELVKEVRDAERELEQLAQSSEIAEREIERERVAADLASALEHYCVAWLADHLLDTALRRYERERQPEVVARASSLFRAVTGGRYVDLVTRADAESSTRPELVALDAAGTALDAGSLSRGTAEQLYLCLRLALASSFARTAATLPIVLDDVLVNFDPARAAAVARAVVEAAETQQVVAFTCHPHLVEVLRRAACGARVVDLPASR
ncbi:MAG: hypothetical protein M0Z33_13840, partial [Actinomycetota bacterium]|nr:hypothetical protein [Actinomycetota bacterium]